MTELISNPGFIAIVTTILGGIGLKVVETWLGRAKSRSDADLAYRTELRADIDRMRQQLLDSEAEEARLQVEIEKWKNAYYDLRDEKQKVVTELTIVMDKLRAQQASEKGA